ncbi:MAG: HPP family protein [Gammaproteobacteria bacterium]|nr:HPP family protein [Gammaproteobacteria bacterium]
MLRRFLTRKQAAEPYTKAIKAGIGGAIAIATLVLLGYISDSPLLMAPFGATCVLLFSLPKSPLSQPINVIAGHVVSIIIGLTLNYFLPLDWWSLGLAVGLAIAAMAALRVTHPPAGADPIVVFFSGPGWEYAIVPVALGSIALVFTAWVFHKIPPKTDYPLSEHND